VLQNTKNKNCEHTGMLYCRFDKEFLFFEGGGVVIRRSPTGLRLPSTCFVSCLKEEKKIAFV
jgi:hypothetical protein